MERPDYDYAKNCQLHFFAPVEGREAVCHIPDTEGNMAVTIKVTLSGDGLTSCVEGVRREEIMDSKVIVHDRNGRIREMDL